MDGLVGRDFELRQLYQMVDTAQHTGGSLVLLGEPGIGKSSVLREVARYGHRRGHAILEVAGIEPEAGLPFAGLLHLLRPVLEHADALPEVQRRALLVAFEIEEGPSPQPFLIALACLTLLTEAAARRPVLLIVDDAQWLDTPTHEVLAFVARRLGRDPIALVATVRAGHDGPLLHTDVDTLALSGLDDTAARAVLRDRAGELDAVGQSAILRHAMGNPLALVELPAAWRALPAGDAGLNPSFMPLTARLERAFAARLGELPAVVHDALLIAAVNDGESLREVIAATAELHGSPVDLDVLEPAAGIGLLSYDARRVTFRHPLVRSGILQSQSAARRRAAHAALARTLIDQPYRRTWHRAQSILGTDDAVADELEDSHRIALRRGSVMSAVWALEKSAQLTSTSARRGRRLLLAAQHAFSLGRADMVDNLLRAAAQDELSELDRARMEWLREIFNDGIPGDATRVRELCGIAERSAAAGDCDLALNLLLGAALRCWWADAGASARAGVRAAAGHVRRRQPQAAGDPRIIAAIAVAEPVAAAAEVGEALSAIVLESVTDADALRLYAMAAHAVGDPVRSIDIGSRAESKLRELGQLGLLSHVLTMQILDRIEVGDWEKATACVEEGKRVARDTGQPIWNDGTLTLSAILTSVRGEYEEALALAAQAEHLADGRRLNDLLSCVQLARGFAAVATSRYAEGFSELRRVFDPTDSAFHLTERFHAIALFAEAAARCDEIESATKILGDLERETGPAAAPTVRVHLAYARAVLAPDSEAEKHYQAALAGDLVRWPWARARLELAYGSWLRRQRRLAEARQPLRSAQTTCELIGATTWADQARAELRAAGERLAPSGPAPRELLSAQELQVARLAADGLSNREIGERLFLSPRTISSHLYRIFPKLGISSRGQLASRLNMTLRSAPAIVEILDRWLHRLASCLNVAAVQSSLGQSTSSWLSCHAVPGGSPYPERAWIERSAAGAVRMIETGQSAGRGGWLHRDTAVLGVHYQRGPWRIASTAGCLAAAHDVSADRRAGLAPVSRATSATSSARQAVPRHHPATLRKRLISSHSCLVHRRGGNAQMGERGCAPGQSPHQQANRGKANLFR